MSQEVPPMAEAMRWVSQVTNISLFFALPPAFGAWVDFKLGVLPLFTLLGFVLGFVGGLYQLIQLIKTANNNQKSS